MTREENQGCNWPIRRGATKHHDWFALVNKYLRVKIRWISLKLTEIWPISDRFLTQKYCCITVHYRTACISENRLGQTVQTLGHLELFSDYVRWPTPNWIPELYSKFSFGEVYRRVYRRKLVLWRCVSGAVKLDFPPPTICLSNWKFWIWSSPF